MPIRTLANDLILQPPRKLNTRNINSPPIDIPQPNCQRQTNAPTDQKTQTVLEIRLFTHYVPNVGHERVAQGVQDGPMDDVEGEGDLA